jgi:aspartyl-tRNA(Asn)/glutamyl-tRNA(Gln) amidotransferase subunit A
VSTLSNYTALSDLAACLRYETRAVYDILDHILERRADATDPVSPYTGWSAERLVASAESIRHVLRMGNQIGPLTGLPISIKDLYGFPGLPTYAGTPTRLPPQWEVAGPIVAALIKQGALISGKTLSGELALGGLGLNPHWGTPSNPWSPFLRRVPGGSSSGAGASIVEGTAWAALGTDTGGSVRVPASYHGLVGLKLTYGRWPMMGVVPLAAMFDSPGLLTRTVSDAAYLFSSIDTALAGGIQKVPIAQPTPLARLRIGIGSPRLWDDCDATILTVCGDFLTKLGALGVRLMDVAFPESANAAQHTREHSFVAAECERFVRLELPELRTHLSRTTLKILAEGATLRDQEVLARQRRFGHLLQRGVTVFDQVDLVACPTVTVPSPTLAEVQDYDRYRLLNSAALRNTVIANLLGLCALTLPVGLGRHGLPVGLQLMAPAGAEAVLLSAALAMEQRLGIPLDRLGCPERSAAGHQVPENSVRL